MINNHTKFKDTKVAMLPQSDGKLLMPKKGKECAYCGNTADTKDHIPSKNLFKGIGLDPILVPSCKKCNESFEKDEEYFRNILHMLCEHSVAANYLFETAIKRSMQKSPGLGFYMLNKMKVVDLISPSGIYQGKKTAYKLNDKDHRRINHVLDKYIQGLYLHEYGEKIPSGYKIKHFWINGKREKLFADMTGNYYWKTIKKEIFIYGHNKIDGVAESIWALAFFERPLFMSFVMTKDKIKEMEKKNAK